MPVCSPYHCFRIDDPIIPHVIEIRIGERITFTDDFRPFVPESIYVLILQHAAPADALMVNQYCFRLY